MTNTPQSSSEEKQLEKVLIDLYETAVLHGEALANVALPTLNERITVLVSAKAAIQTLYISRQEAAAERERAVLEARLAARADEIEGIDNYLTRRKSELAVVRKHPTALPNQPQREKP